MAKYDRYKNTTAINEKSRAKKMLEPLFEQKRILQFNNQNLHNSNIHYILR